MNFPLASIEFLWVLLLMILVVKWVLRRYTDKTYNKEEIEMNLITDLALITLL